MEAGDSLKHNYLLIRSKSLEHHPDNSVNRTIRNNLTLTTHELSVLKVAKYMSTAVYLQFLQKKKLLRQHGFFFFLSKLLNRDNSHLIEWFNNAHTSLAN